MNKLLLLAFTALAQAQSVEIYSEFQRPDPFGGIVRADKAWRPREILSPAVPRGGFATFHVAVSVPAKESYLLYVVTNPIDACRVSLYRERFTQTANGWIPDRLTELHQLPDFGTMPDPEDNVPGQTTRAYLLDIWIPPDATPGRFRLEVQLKVAEWIIRPLEIRVEEPTVPAVPAVPALSEARRVEPSLPPIDSPADASAVAALRSSIHGETLPPSPPPANVRGFLRRNALQDLSLAADPVTVQRRALELLKMNSMFSTRPLGAEWWLRVRDFLISQR